MVPKEPRTPVRPADRDMRVPGQRTEALATLTVGALDGASLMARAEQDVRPPTTVV